MPPPSVLLLSNEPVLSPDHPDIASELEILETIEIVGKILADAGFRTSRLAVGRDLHDLIDGLYQGRPAAVFNLFEGLADRPATESVVAGVLEWLEIAFTGSTADTIALARDKQRTKTLLHGAGLPTPPFFTVAELPCPRCRLPWPVIVKPADLDCSIGIDQDSVVTNQKALERRVEFVLERHGPALVEQFIHGREFHVSLVDGAHDGRGHCPAYVLPLAEIVFKDPALWPIYSYAAKWAEDSHEHSAAPEEAPVVVPDAWLDRITDIAKRAYALLGCRDYARIDLRVTTAGEPFILEVNPNPDVNSIGLINGLEAIGRSHPQFIVDLAWAALGRRTPHRQPEQPSRAHALAAPQK